jgi:hypothetical protein
MGDESTTYPGADGGKFSGDGAASADAGAAPASLSPDLNPTDNGVIIVHAGGVGAFRLCFENDLDNLPQPDSTVMPEANVVGVEVGSAVRLPPFKGPPGQVFLFEEALIRGAYPTFGGAGKGSTCRKLLESAATHSLALSVGTIATDFSHGVQLAVVRGCTPPTLSRTYTTAECGADYEPSTGNLSITAMTLQPFARNNTSTLPAQVVHLSQALESARGNQTLKIGFGAGETITETIASNPPLFGGPNPASPIELSYQPSVTASYATTGFRIALSAGGAPDTVVFKQSLAEVQKLSAPRDLPTTYYAQASNYVLLLLGAPAPAADAGDAGPSDDLRGLHLLAVPVVAPKEDGGPDGAAPATTAADGG